MMTVRTADQPRIRLILRPFQEFARRSTAGGILLLASAIIALLWANSPWGHLYEQLWHTEIAIVLGGFHLEEDLLHWINDGLMAIFFLFVGLEIKREVLIGELASVRRAALPLVAAAGGMLVPAGLYIAVNGGTEGARGWGIPMATDIAFALGIMALLGRRVPLSLKVFLVALAIVDDIGAVLVIAVFYTSELSLMHLAAGAVFLLLLLGANRAGFRHPLPYIVLGLGLWVAFLESGVHATVAGVLLALTIPSSIRMNTRDFLTQGRAFLDSFERAGVSAQKRHMQDGHRAAVYALESACEYVESPMQRLEHALYPWVTYLIMPVFGLANAGVVLSGNLGATVTHSVSLGVIVGLVVGKQGGITLFSWLAIRLGVASLPRGVTWRQLYGAAWLGGIGFTMSIFIANLAFGGTALLPIAKMGILLASLTAGTVGWFILAFTKTASLTHEAPATAPASSPDGVTPSLVADR